MKNVILVGLVAFGLVACGAKEEAVVVEEAAPVAEEAAAPAEVAETPAADVTADPVVETPVAQ